MRITLAVFILLLATPVGWAVVTIVAPIDQGVTHDMTDASQGFAESIWSLVSTEARGASVILSGAAFVHGANSAFRVDSRLDLRVVASALADWAVITGSDQTNVGGGDLSASVSAASTVVGDGTLGLTVTFVDADFSVLAAGSYSVTVTGTITANP